MNLPHLFCVAGFAACLLPATATAAPSDNLLGYWPLDNSTADEAPGGAAADDGAWVGSANYSLSAPFDAGGVFDGGSHVAIPSSADLAHPSGNITLSAWFKVDSFDKNWQCLLSKGEGSNFRIARQSNADAISYAGGSADISGGSVNDGAWHHVVAISEVGSNTFLYLDGALIATGSAPSLADAGLPLLIGENPGATGRQWNGEIDDVGLFGTALTQFQAQALYTFGEVHGYPLADAVAILDRHAAGSGAVAIGDDTWNYEPADPGTGTFVLLGADGSGVDLSTGPPISSFTSSPLFIESGQSATLSWQVTPPFTALAINNGVGDVLAATDAAGAGSTTVSPLSSSTFTLTATNDDGTTQRTTTVFVDVDPSTPRINEFVANPTADGLLDEDGEAEDWIEVFNPGPGAADLSTYYLTDDPLVPNKWAFPTVALAENTYLIVFASNKNRAEAGSELHTNFGLSAGGEYLALTRDDGAGGFEVVSQYSPEYPDQVEGFYYGIDADGVAVGYLATPSPGAANGQTSLGFVGDTSFDIDRGFFSAPFDLTITTATPDAEIRYTTDGSTPTSATGTVYAGPVTISNTTTLRAAAFKDGFFQTNVDTHTYFFLDDVRTQFADGAAPPGWPSSSVNSQEFNYGMDPDITNRYSAQEMIDALSAIPSVSLVTDQANLTSASTGIYVNAGSHGRTWERAASFEIIHPDGSLANLQSDCGLRIRGGFSRSGGNPKHAFRLFFRSEYGSGKLRYPLFGAEGVDAFDKVDLRTSQNYSWAFQGKGQNTFLREVLGRDLQGAFGQPYTRSRYYHLYLNGVYWGLYMTQERAEANHGEAYLGGDDDDYDTVKSAGSSGSYNTEATDGSIAPGSDWETLWQMARDQQATPTVDRFMDMQGLLPDGARDPGKPIFLDVDNLVDYTLIIGYTGNYDAPLSNFIGASNNWYAVRDRARNLHGFQFFVHDGEHSMGAGGGWGGANDRINTTNGSNQRANYSKGNPAFIHFDLAEGTPEYRLRFADRAHAALFNGGLLTTGSVRAFMEARRSAVTDVIIAESARWGDSKRSDPYDEGDWNNAVNGLITIINGRTDDFLGHLRIADLYPDLAAPVYSQHGGFVAAGSNISATVPDTGTELYYKIGTGDSDSADWQDPLDPRLLGGTPDPTASSIAIGGGGGGGVTATDYISEGDSWSYLDDGSDQGTAWRAASFDDSGWATGASELGYGDGDEVTVISDAPGSPNRPATSYFRKSVTIPDPAVFGTFEIRITYDDAYAIYVNGTEVARHSGLAPGAAFDTYATNTVGDNAIDTLTIPKFAFASGANTVAVEIHQSSGGSSDVSFNLALTGLPPAGDQVVLGIPEAIDVPVWIKSRTYDSATGEWSALNQAFFTTAPAAVPAGVVISEVHYHPLAPSTAELAVDPSFDQDDFEFVEILNIGAETADLGGAAFVEIPIGDHLEGIRFTFPQGTLIAPGERFVVVADAAAFAARYPGVPIAGDYSGRLDNTGEWITLVDATGAVIDSFRYNDVDPWPVAADGTGPSLVRQSPEAKPDPALATSWSASPASGGSPATIDGIVFVGDPLADEDSDGAAAILEFFQGLSDSEDSVALFPRYTFPGDNTFTISYRRDPLVIGVTPFVDVSDDLGVWIDAETAGSLEFVGEADDPDGIPRLTFRFVPAGGGDLPRFVRFGVQF